MLRIVRRAAHRGSFIAAAVGETLFVAIALLIVTVGVLATESRIPETGRSAASWHASKSSRMAEGGGDELASPQKDDSQPAAPIIRTEVLFRFFPNSSFQFPLRELAGAPQAHGLRAPPRA